MKNMMSDKDRRDTHKIEVILTGIEQIAIFVRYFGISLKSLEDEMVMREESDAKPVAGVRRKKLASKRSTVN